MWIFLIEDDAMIARELALRWTSAGWRVTTCGSLAQAEALDEGLRADVLVLDLTLPDGDGLAWLERLRRRDRHTPVIVITARAEVSDRVKALRAGADDYLVKPFAGEELDARIEAVVRRSRLTPGERMQCGRLVWLRDEAQVLLDDQPLDLHRRELQVLTALMRRSPRLASRSYLLQEIEQGDNADFAALDVYISRLRRKISDSGTRLITIRGLGYRLEAERDDTVAEESELST